MHMQADMSNSIKRSSVVFILSPRNILKLFLRAGSLNKHVLERFRGYMSC